VKSAKLIVPEVYPGRPYPKPARSLDGQHLPGTPIVVVVSDTQATRLLAALMDHWSINSFVGVETVADRR
jgi:hypothetical protein